MHHPLDTDNRLDLNAAVFLAEASQAAYDEDAAADLWAKANGFPQGVESFSNSNVQGFFAVEGNVALLALRGTQSAAHWMRNLSVIPSKHEWGHVHVGFHDGITQIENVAIRTFIEKARGKRVWITGHSLGGAMAVIAAARLKLSGVSATTYTYGQPMMCFNNFADRFAMELPGRYHRFVNQNDIVPRVPPGYTHFGVLKRIVKPGAFGDIRLEAVSAPDPVLTPYAAAARASIELEAVESARAVEEAGITEPLFIDSELPPLNDQQFRELQVTLAVEESVLPGSDPSPAPEGTGLEGLPFNFALPSFRDHAIRNYIDLLMEIRDRG